MQAVTVRLAGSAAARRCRNCGVRLISGTRISTCPARGHAFGGGGEVHLGLAAPGDALGAERARTILRRKPTPDAALLLIGIVSAMLRATSATTASVPPARLPRRRSRSTASRPPRLRRQTGASRPGPSAALVVGRDEFGEPGVAMSAGSGSAASRLPAMGSSSPSVAASALLGTSDSDTTATTTPERFRRARRTRATAPGSTVSPSGTQ